MPPCSRGASEEAAALQRLSHGGRWLARELEQFGYRETDDPDEADRRRFYKVEKWDADELHVEALLHASNDLSRARAIFADEKARRPRGRYTLRQNIRVLDRWPPDRA